MNWIPKQEVLEIRYAKAPLLWDCAGSLATETIAAFPSLSVDSGNPSQIVLSSSKPAIGVSYGLESTHARVMPEHASKANWQELVTFSMKVAISRLKVATLIRVGHRLMFEVKADSEENARDLCSGVIKRAGLGSFFENGEDDRLKGKAPVV